MACPESEGKRFSSLRFGSVGVSNRACRCRRRQGKTSGSAAPSAIFPFLIRAEREGGSWSRVRRKPGPLRAVRRADRRTLGLYQRTALGALPWSHDHSENFNTVRLESSEAPPPDLLDRAVAGESCSCSSPPALGVLRARRSTVPRPRPRARGGVN
jgi:hypothetical protein